MDEDEPAIVSGDIENIVIKPEYIELLFDIEPVLSDDDIIEDDLELTENIVDECCFVTSSGEVVTLNNEDVVQTPFYLESYFVADYRYRSGSPCIPHQQKTIMEIDRITCYECDIVFCNEHRLLEHLMTHIDVYRMGCDVCDKDLNLDEKFQLHMMAVTWQSVYYCDFCRKSCAGVVRSKSQPSPPGKTYMCHDCEYRTEQETTDFQNTVHLYENLKNNPVYVPPGPPQRLLPQRLSPSLPPVLPPQVVTTPAPPQIVVPTVPPRMVVPSTISKIVVPSTPLPQIVVPTIPPPQIVVPTITPPQTVRPSATPPPPMEVLQDHKQKPTIETKYEECNYFSTENATPEVQDCYLSRKSPPKKKENKKCRRQKPKLQIVSESMKQTLKMSTRSYTREKNKLMSSYQCRYCPVAFTEHFVLMTHLREKHKFHKLRYVCKLCGKEFLQQRCYENHVSFHQLAKNHICFVCNLAFLSKYELEEHAHMHHKSEIINTYCNSPESVALDLRKKKCKTDT